MARGQPSGMNIFDDFDKLRLPGLGQPVEVFDTNLSKNSRLPVEKYDTRPVLLGLLGLECTSTKEYLPSVPMVLLEISTCHNALPIFLLIWRTTVMEMKRSRDGSIPIVHVEQKDRKRFGLHRQTVNAQLTRLAQAGLIEIVDEQSGRMWRVRLRPWTPEQSKDVA
jgi:hypothetical protein